MRALTVGEAAAQTGWSPRMLRYLERTGLVVPARSPAAYRLYDDGDVERLAALRDVRARFALGLADLAFALRLRREPVLRRAVDDWLGRGAAADWLRYEQRKGEELLAA